MVASTSELKTLFASLDGDADGRISAAELRAEFLKLALHCDAEEERTRGLKEAFGMYEMEEGCITPASLGRMLGRLRNGRGIGECRAMICRFDLDGDGVLSFDEFKIMMSA
ncbi:hypothetical protein QYE76_058206 [Lolium multiflorum]|uniref:EF-hand domain-containing protein n=1 Tax=Lolium multiflorum TaxID=4521 RepID=A0AAD8T4S6_LOLMU|nr:hypothetical protein QYE76_058206 [Lolium multiflorum]